MLDLSCHLIGLSHSGFEQGGSGGRRRGGGEKEGSRDGGLCYTLLGLLLDFLVLGDVDLIYQWDG